MLKLCKEGRNNIFYVSKRIVLSDFNLSTVGDLLDHNSYRSGGSVLSYQNQVNAAVNISILLHMIFGKDCIVYFIAAPDMLTACTACSKKPSWPPPVMEPRLLSRRTP